MTKFGILALVIFAVLTGCGPLGKKPRPASLFAAPLSATLLSVKIPVRGAEATLLLVARNQAVETWQTGDAVSISLRDGMIVGTRGLGFDVIGSDVQQSLAAIAGRVSGSYTVQRSYLTADNHRDLVTATCTMGRSGTDGHLVEDCQTEAGPYRNEYWLDGSGRIARSNQWIGPQVQYLSLSYVTGG